jgi:ankyrin repeat protein
MQTMKEILDAGGNVNFVGDNGLTSLMIASSDGNIECAKYLLFRGADIEIVSRVEGKSALQFAEDNDDKAMMRLLKDAELRLKRGQSACEYKEPELIRNAAKGKEESLRGALMPQPKMSGGKEEIKIGSKIASNPFLVKDRKV